MCNPASDATLMPFGRPPNIPCDAGSAYVMSRCTCTYFVPYVFASSGLLLAPLLVAWLAQWAAALWRRHRRHAPGQEAERAGGGSGGGDAQPEAASLDLELIHASPSEGGKPTRLNLADVVRSAVEEEGGGQLLVCVCGSAAFKRAARAAVREQAPSGTQVVDLGQASADDSFWW